MSLQGTVAAQEAANREWPVIVVGAGPAGAFAAYRLARSGVRSLLIDRQPFPRAKVCGGCLNARTLAFLSDSGLGDLPASLGAEPLARFALHACGRTVSLPLPAGVAVSRTAFDAGLVQAAVAAGADFLPGTHANLAAAVSGACRVRLPHVGHELLARRVVVADGLGGSFLPGGSGRRAHPAPASRIGAGAVFDDVQEAFEPGVLHMAVGRQGYVGLTRVEHGQLCVAAALDRSALEGGASLGDAVAAILEETGLRLPEAGSRPWRGTAALSRRAPSVAFEGVFLIGDAAGYVEPFTGEGISWSLEAAGEVAGVLAAGTGEGAFRAPEAVWNQRYQRRIVRRQRWCRAVSWGLKQRTLVASMSWMLDKRPLLARPLMAHLNKAPGAGLS